MRWVLVAAVSLGLCGAVPAGAQSLNDVGRALGDQLLGGRPGPDRDREAYERGRRDQEESRREEARREEDRRRAGAGRGGYEERRSDEGRRRVEDERRREVPQYGEQRREPERGYDEPRGRGRY